MDIERRKFFNQKVTFDLVPLWLNQVLLSTTEPLSMHLSFHHSHVLFYFSLCLFFPSIYNIPLLYLTSLFLLFFLLLSYFLSQFFSLSFKLTFSYSFLSFHFFIINSFLFLLLYSLSFCLIFLFSLSF